MAQKQDEIYFDYAASTPVSPEVVSVMEPYYAVDFANPNAVHSLGQKAQAALDRARKQIADLCAVDFTSVIFTASATETNNLLLRGIVKQWRKTHSQTKAHVVTTSIEHASVLDTCRDMERSGEAEVSYAKPGNNGIVAVSEIMKLVRPDTVCVSVMAVNNVTGAIQPISELARAVSALRQEKLKQAKHALQDAWYPVLHADAAQAAYGVPDELTLRNLQADFLTLCSHKICGPKGAAALIMRMKALPDQRILAPLVTGGDQEFGLHSGTQNVPAIVGFAAAFSTAQASRGAEYVRLAKLKEKFLSQVMDIYPGAVCNSPEDSIPGIINISFPGMHYDELLYQFDKAGLAISVGSACHARLVEPSHVLQAMGVGQKRLESAIRFSFGKYTDEPQIFEAAKRMRAHFTRAHLAAS